VTIGGESLVSHAGGSPLGEKLARLATGVVRSCLVAPLLFSGPIGVHTLLHTYSNTPDAAHRPESVTRTIRKADLQDEPALWAPSGPGISMIA
jgi:hypothetical protein